METARRYLVAPLVAVAVVLTPPACDSAGTSAGAAAALIITAELTELPGHVGQNTMTIEVRDLAGDAVAGADVVVVPEMVIHGHGSTEDATVVDGGAGLYTAFPVTFTMPGPWTVNITATDAFGAEGTLAFETEVE